MAKKLIAANWKENPISEKDALRLFRAVASVRHGRAVDVAVCVPDIFLEAVARAYRGMRGRRAGLSIGAENVFWEEQGPFTGEIGPKTLAALGVRYVIVGHSERRRWMKETDAMINKKVKRSLKDGLTVILCVGEPLAIRKKGRRAAESFVKSQLKKDLQGVRKGSIIIAYEPIWAIGTGMAARPEDAAAMARCIKKAVPLAVGEGKSKVKVLYGGSVDGANARDYIQLKEIDGALVGGASLKAGEFKKIIKSA